MERGCPCKACVLPLLTASFAEEEENVKSRIQPIMKTSGANYQTQVYIFEIKSRYINTKSLFTKNLKSFIISVNSVKKNDLPTEPHSL